MDNYKATPEQWQQLEEWSRFPSSSVSCILELRARVMALEAQANHFVDAPKMVPLPVATDEELSETWYKAPGERINRFRAIYNLGIEHGIARSREVADPAPVAGALEIAVLVTELSRIAKDVSASGRFTDANILARAASLVNQLDVQLPKRDGDPAPVAGELMERVSDAITSETGSRWATTEARAAVLEVARWLREQGIPASGWAMRLEQEAGR